MTDTFYKVVGTSTIGLSSPEFITIKDINSAFIIDLSSGDFVLFYNQGYISSLGSFSNQLITAFNLQQPNPYDLQTGEPIEDPNKFTTVAFVILHNDTEQPIKGAVVTIGGVSEFTNDVGRTQVILKTNQSYSYKVVGSGFQRYNGAVELSSNQSYITQIIKLEPVLIPEEISEKQTKELTINYSDVSKALHFEFSGGISKFATETAPEIIPKINAIIQPSGWILSGMTVTNSQIKFQVQEVGSVALTLGLIAAVILIIAKAIVLFGLIITSWKFIDVKKQQVEIENTKTVGDIASELSDAGFTTEEITAILTTLEQEEEKDNQITTIILIGVAAALAGALIVTMVKK